MKTKLKLLSLTAYDNSNGWKLDANGNIELKDGNPVYINAAGQEMTVAQDTISRLNNEAKSLRESKEEVLNRFKAFEGLDAVKAREALATVSKLDAKQLMDSGKVDELKNQITSQFQSQLGEKDKAYAELQGKYEGMLVNNIFKGSEFARNNIAVPFDMFEATFKSNFKVEDGKVAAYGKDGNRLLSKTRAGEYADPEEALQLLVDAHPQKDQILRADVGSGSGSGGNGGNRPNSNMSIKRSEFEKLPPFKQAEISKKVSAGEMRLTD